MMLAVLMGLSGSVVTNLPDLTAYINQSALTYTSRAAIGWTAGFDVKVEIEREDGSAAPEWTTAEVRALQEPATLWEEKFTAEADGFAQTVFMDNGVTVVASNEVVQVYNTSVTEFSSPPALQLLASIPAAPLIFRRIAAFGDTLYIGTTTNIIIFSLADPKSPALLGSGSPDTGCGNATVDYFSVVRNSSSSMVYGLVCCSGRITAVDFTAPNNMKILDQTGDLDTFDSCYTGHGDTVYLIHHYNRLLVQYTYGAGVTSKEISIDVLTTLWSCAAVDLNGAGTTLAVSVVGNGGGSWVYLYSTGGDLKKTYDGRTEDAMCTLFSDGGVLYGFQCRDLIRRDQDILYRFNADKTMDTLQLYSGVAERASKTTERVRWAPEGRVLATTCQNGVLSVLSQSKTSVFGVGSWLVMGVGSVTNNEDVSLVVKGTYQDGTSAPALHRTVHYEGYAPPLVTHSIGTIAPLVTEGDFHSTILWKDYFQSLYPSETLVFEMDGTVPSWMSVTPLNETNPYLHGTLTTGGTAKGVCVDQVRGAVALLLQSSDDTYKVEFFDVRNYVFTKNGSMALNVTQNVTATQPISSWAGAESYTSVAAGTVVYSYFWKNTTLRQPDALFTTVQFMAGPFAVATGNAAFVFEESKMFVAGVLADGVPIKAMYSTDSHTVYILSDTALLTYVWDGSTFSLAKNTTIPDAGGYSCVVIDTTFNYAAMCKGTDLVLMGLDDAIVVGVYKGQDTLEDAALVKPGVSVVMHKKGAAIVSWETGLELNGRNAVSGTVDLSVRLVSSLGPVAYQNFSLDVRSET